MHRQPGLRVEQNPHNKRPNITERAIPKFKNDIITHETSRYGRSVRIRPVILAGVTRVHAWEVPRVSLSQNVDIFPENEEESPTVGPADVRHGSFSDAYHHTRTRATRLYVALHVEMFRDLADGSTDSKHVHPFCFS